MSRRDDAIAAIFHDLRGRKLLKYLFEEAPDNVGAYGYIDAPIDLETQRECVGKWVDLVLATPPTTDASERLREALDDVLGWAIGNHDEGCTLDPEYGDPEATECTCGLDDKIAKARAALAPSNGEVSGDK